LAVARLGRELGAGAVLAGLAVFEAGLAAALEAGLAGAWKYQFMIYYLYDTHLLAIGFR